ncbi:ATP-dependent DNA helicase RecQ [Belliella baltica DSM 15883]|uniref:DNA helicase RecQ n=1 Tax=Belliella baltica (strain DSM 15883 / CIP 108006 / LMG 21964 / BA134) TaxID=866536 RepID=I3Z178_BELBD|nr:DNA helicase RecQ [Belliella baltica]AFL82996.1 ATP-dependent DNA helicase RecQ [Belliella baltica DSM 15883]
MNQAESVVKSEGILKEFFGYSEFRGNQKQIIQSVLSKKDTIVLMPTGGGKSVCYQVPAMIFDGLTLVISPLISLMKDQVDALNANGIPAAFLNSSQSQSEQRFISSQIQSGKIKLLYIAPERLYRGDYPLIDFLKTVNLSLVAIDEAHCVSQWGHDFRPEYLKIGELRKSFPQIPFIALTATADKLTRKDIADKLGLKTPQWFISSFDRSNITYRVTAKRDAMGKLLEFLDFHKKDSGVIYCLSRKNVEETASELQARGLSALPYHAGLPREEREKNQELFIKDEVKIMVATIAFGMGIDKSNVRFVVHMNMPQNVEGYYQETGRAGRDGLPSDALLFYSGQDANTLGRMLDRGDNQEFAHVMQEKLEKMKSFCQTKICRRKFLLNYFGEDHTGDCGNCDICFQKGNRQDMTIPSQMLLSTIARLGESFGIGYVLLILRGSKSAKVQEAHQSLSVYGIGKDRPESFWKDLCDKLVQEDYLAEAGAQFPTLKLTEFAWQKLKAKEKILLPMEEALPEVSNKPSTYHEELLDELKALRFSIAQKSGVPPYVVFADSSLVEMATYLPIDEQSFLEISGVGQVKAQSYGSDFMKIIADYAEKNKLTPKRKILTQRTKPLRNSQSELMTMKLFNEGKNIYQIAEARGMTFNTVEDHLVNMVKKKELDAEKFLSKDDLLNIRLAYRRQGTHFLKPLKEHFGERYSYFQLKVALAEER